MKLEELVFGSGRLTGPMGAASDDGTGSGSEDRRSRVDVALLSVKRLALYFTAEEWSEGWAVKDVEIDA